MCNAVRNGYSSSQLSAALGHLQHHERRLEDDAELGAQERIEALERGGVREVVEQLDAHVIGERALRLLELPRVLQRRGELGDLAARGDRAGGAERDLLQAGESGGDVPQSLP